MLKLKKIEEVASSSDGHLSPATAAAMRERGERYRKRKRKERRDDKWAHSAMSAYSVS